MGGHYCDRNYRCKDGGEHDDDEPGGTIGSLRRWLRDSHGVDKGVRDELDELHVFSMAGREDSSRDQKVQRFLGWRRIGNDWRASINAALMGEGLPERRQAHTLKDV
jgi:hypothetical protein